MDGAQEPYRHGRVPRRHRRVLLVLLIGAGDLGGYTLCHAAQVGPGTVYQVLDRLEKADWVSAEWEVVPLGEDRPRRRFYQLTLKGRVRSMKLLGLVDRG